MSTATAGPVRLMTTEEFASAMRVAPRTLRRWAAEGLVPARRIPGGELRFHPDTLAEVGEPASAASAA